MARTGRRPGNADTRQAILDVARTQFAELGYEGVSLRGIARAAGVDAALVHHYFDGKSGLFAEVMQLPLDPAVALPGVLDGDVEQLGERLLRFFLALWESPETGPRMRAAIRTALSSEEASTRLGHFVVQEILGRLATRLGSDQAMTRATLTGTQLIGLAVARYLVQADPLIRMSVEEIVAAVAPTLQGYLTGDLAEVLAAEPVQA
ncbi:MAG: TetR/AcrR family transcriptional regulator [Geodermatophilaceae bacterium]|nr:TetR/AcrR family transcriptional regulator [Geodermatophilaceae bacterium]